MKTDLYGAPIGVQTQAGMDAWNALLPAFLAHSASAPKHLEALLEAEPDLAVAHALKGLFCLMLARRETIQAAKNSHSEAVRLRRASGVLSEREASICDALSFWLQERPDQAAHILAQHLSRDPGDSLLHKLVHAIRFMIGDAEGMLQTAKMGLPAHDANHPGRGYLLGCLAFAHEETGDYQAAEAFGREGLALAADDAWGLHAVAHVYEMTNRPEDGLDWLEGREAAWAHCNNFRYHVWWHKALMHLDQGDIAEVLTLYDQEIRVDQTDDFRDIANATSLLQRLVQEGVDVGHRWEELALFCEARTEDNALVFADLHYALALIGGGRKEALNTLVGRLEGSNSDMAVGSKAVIADPGRAAACALHAYSNGLFSSAFDHFLQSRHSMPRIGGSHAQRDVFERLAIDCGIRAGKFTEAEQLLQERRSLRNRGDDSFSSARMELLRELRNAAASAA